MTDITSGPDIVGLIDVARRLGVAPATARIWRKRARTAVLRVPFPEPDGRVGNVPWWHWETVEAWARQTGRLK